MGGTNRISENAQFKSCRQFGQQEIHKKMFSQMNLLAGTGNH